MESFTKTTSYFKRNFDGYMCLMMLSIDEEGKSCYILGRKNTNVDFDSPQRKKRGIQAFRNHRNSSSSVMTQDFKFSQIMKPHDSQYAIIRHEFESKDRASMN